jgi:hypothetical protein
MIKQSYNLTTMILVFFVLYIYQGFLYGYTESIKFLLRENGVGYEKIAIFDFVGMPNYLKFFFAPVLDIYFSRKFGKRMTYIVPFSVISGTIFIYLAFNIPVLIASGSVGEITGLMLTLSFAICIQDVAIDSLVEEIFTENHTKFGPLMQTLGQIVGPIISFNIFIMAYDGFKDISFYFPLIIGLFIPLSTLWVKMVVRENEPRSEFSSPLELVKILPNFVRNKNLRLYLIYLVTNSIGFVFWKNAMPMLLLDMGFKKTYISELSTIMTVLGFAFMFVLFRINISDNIFRYIRLSYGVSILLYFIQFAIVSNFDMTRNANTTYYSLLAFQPIELLGYLEFSAKATFNNLICDYSLASTFLAIIASLNNFAGLFFKPLFSYLMSKLDYKVGVAIFLSYTVGYYLVIMPRIFGRLSKLKREDFRVGSFKKVE